MFVSFVITAAKAIMATPVFDICELGVIATLALACMGVLVWIACECWGTLVIGWQDARRRNAKRDLVRTARGSEAADLASWASSSLYIIERAGKR